MTSIRRSIAVLIGIALLSGICGAVLLASRWLPQRGAGNRALNERSASTSLKMMSYAEADLRAHDRDGNGVHDFWTGDVTELYRLGLIERGIAEADTRPLHPLVPNPIPYHGYFFEALLFDNSLAPPEAYGQDTDKKSGKVHHLERFGFIAYPAESAGKYFYMINEYNSVFRVAATMPRPTNWPADDERRSLWSHAE